MSRRPREWRLKDAEKWRRRESNPCDGSEQKREMTPTYPPNPRNRLDLSLPFDPAPSRLVPSNGAESGHKEGTKSIGVRALESETSLCDHGSLWSTMSRPEKLIPPSLEEAVAELKRDPSHPVHARVDGLDVELRVVPSNETQPGLGSRLAAI